MSFGILTLLGIWFPKIGFVGTGLVIIMTIGTLSFLVTTPEVWVPDLGSGEHGFPLLTGAGEIGNKGRMYSCLGSSSLSRLCAANT